MTAAESVIARIKAAIVCVEANELEAARVIVQGVYDEVAGDAAPEDDETDVPVSGLG